MRSPASTRPVTGLYQAMVLMPQDPSLRARAAVEFIRAGDVKGARTVLAPAAFNPHGSQDNRERKVIEQIDKGDSPQALLAYADKEKFLLRVNDFTGLDLAKEEGDKDKDKDKDKGRRKGN